MRRYFILSVFVCLGLLLANTVSAQVGIESQPLDSRLKVQVYTEYINFSDEPIDSSAWGGGILARYMFLDWLGAQTNFTYYGDADVDNFNGDLSFSNWRLSAIVHTYVPGVKGEKLPIYVYGGGGLGFQFNSEVVNIDVDDAFTGHILGGIGYDLHENFHLEAELGYQFGTAALSNYTKGDTSVEAAFVRAGVGVSF